MYPSFWSTIDDYIVPIGELKSDVWDSTYFMRGDDSFVFCEGYCHPEGSLYGKIIYYPKEPGNTSIHGRPYECITKRVVDDETIYVSHPDQITRQCELDPSLDRERPAYARYELEFPMRDFKGFFDCGNSLRVAMQRYPRIDQAARDTSEILGIPLERMGVTGSLAYGVYDPDDEDFDVVFYGTVEENRRIVSKIYDLTRDPARQVIEYGKLWPMRFFNNKVLVCPFFVYSDLNEIPLKDFSIEILKAEVAATGHVHDDRHAIYMPAILGLDNVVVDGEKCAPLPLIIYDGALRGDFKMGDKVKCDGMLVRVTRGLEEFEALLVNLCFQIDRVN